MTHISKNEVVVKMLFGSHLYGLNNENSDKDYKAIILPSKEQILMGEANFSISESTGDDKSKNSAEDTDTETFSLQRFLNLAAKGETVAVDMLHAPKSAIVEGSEIWDFLVENRDVFYTKNMKAYVGYVRKQAAKYSIRGSRLSVLEDVIEIVNKYPNTILVDESNNSPTPLKLSRIINLLPKTEYSHVIASYNEKTGEQMFYELLGRKYQSTLRISEFKAQLAKLYDSYGERAKAAKNNEWIDWKALSHALRAGYQALLIYTQGGFSYPLPQTDFLMKVKQGELDYVTEVQPVLEDLVDEVMELAENSDYPESVNSKWVRKFILDIHEAIVV